MESSYNFLTVKRVKGKVLLQLFNKRKLGNGTKTYLEQKFFFIYSQI